jgi:hypothetical protein
VHVGWLVFCGCPVSARAACAGTLARILTVSSNQMFLGGKQSAGSLSSGSSNATAPLRDFGPRWRGAVTGAYGSSTGSAGLRGYKNLVTSLKTK